VTGVAGGSEVRGNGSGDRDGSARPASPNDDLTVDPSADGAEEEHEEHEEHDLEYDEPRSRPPRPRTSTLVVLVVVLFVVSGAVPAWLRISDLQHRVDTLEARTDASEAARQAAVLLAQDLATYDYRDLGGNFRHVAANATTHFAGQLRELTAQLGPELQRTRAVAKATVRAAGVVRSSVDEAVVAVFVDQTVTNTKSPTPRTEHSRMELTLVKQGAVWRLDQAGEL
jgi:Mce-associated membrane protein